MPRIILNRNTTNPAIPMIPVYGFSDDFNRADGAGLGVTSGESKAWATSAGSWRILGGKANYLGSSAYSHATVDALDADGVMRVKFGAIGNMAAGITLRFTDPSNCVRVYLRTATGDNRPKIEYVTNGTITSTSAPVGSPVVAANSVVEVSAVGSAISVKVDGVQAVAGTTAHLTATRHGFYATSTGLDVYFDEASFTPAP